MACRASRYGPGGAFLVCCGAGGLTGVGWSPLFLSCPCSGLFGVAAFSLAVAVMISAVACRVSGFMVLPFVVFDLVGRAGGSVVVDGEHA